MLMKMDQSVEKFWNLPELVERLVSFLNPRSTLCLLQSNVLEKETLQESFSSKAWTQLIRRSPRSEDGLLEEDLAEILSLLQLDDPSTFLLPLLDLICESSPDVSSPDQDQTATQSLTSSQLMLSCCLRRLRKPLGQLSKA